MERLTIPDEPIEGGTRRAIIDARAVRGEAMTIYWRLKKYEDICPDPERLKEVDRLYLEKCQEVSALQAKSLKEEGIKEKQIRDEAMRKVMWEVGHTNNDVTRYISGAVAKQVVRDERGGWIPAAERLPDKPGDYWVAMRHVDGSVTTVKMFWCPDWPHEDAWNEVVVAWQPYYCPEPFVPQK